MLQIPFYLVINQIVFNIPDIESNSNNSNSKPDIFSVFLFWFSWTVFGVIAYYMGFYTADLFYYLINNYADKLVEEEFLKLAKEVLTEEEFNTLVKLLKKRENSC
jgi:hypothetical protein